MSSIGLLSLSETIKNNNRRHKCVLAEELGHILHPPRPGHTRYHSKSYWDTNFTERNLSKAIVAQDERKALDWATSILMPDVEFWRALSEGVDTIPKLIEHFDVEDWIVRHKIGLIRRQARENGKKLKWRDIISRQ